MTIDVAELKARTDISAVIGSFSRLTRDGKTWRGACPVHGGDGQNLVVYPEAGTWHCFSCNCHDGHSDVIGFVELMLGMDFQRAAEYLGGKNDWKPELVKPARPPMPERVTCKPPPSNEPKSMKHFTFGEPEIARAIRDLDGGLLGYECRYPRGSDPDDPDKSPARMWTWGARGTAKPEWGMGQFSTETALRPLYGLDRLAARPNAPFALFEAPKKADAAQVLLPRYACLSLHGGANAWKRIDFSHLSGKTGLLWPDADRQVVKTDAQAARFGLKVGDLLPYVEQPGPKAMLGIGQMLVDPDGLDCACRIIDVWKDCEMPPGWDIADALADGWTTQQVIDWAGPRASDVIPTVPPKPEPSAAQEPQQLDTGRVSPFPPPEAPTLDRSMQDYPQDEAPEPPTSPNQPEPPPLGSTLERPPRAPRKPRKPYIAASGGNALPEPELDDQILPLELSEIGVAKQFCDLYQNEFRVVHEWGGKHGACWLSWNGSRWVREANRKTAYQKMSLLCTGLKYHAAARGLTEAGKSKLERAQFVSSCLTQAQFDVRLIAAPDIWDADPLMLGTPDGTVDLTIGKLVEASQDQFITRQTTVRPAPGPHPLFDDVIRRAAAGDADMTAYLWRALGYGAITGCVNEEVFWYLWGKPQCGKTTLIEAIADILGDVDEGGYACQVEIDIFTEQKQDSRTADRLAHLAGARFAYASEMEEGKNFKAALLKMAVGGDRMGGKFLYQERFTFKPTHHIWIFGNQIMHLRTADQGIKRRMHLVEYDDRFIVTDEERDNDFKQKLKAEYPAILHSLIQGALDWQQCGGLGKPEQIAQRVDDYMQAEDTLAEFVGACLTLSPNARCKSSAAYSAFKSWCDKSGEYCPSGKRFSQQMRNRGFAMVRSASGQFFSGFSVIERDDERSPPPSYDKD